MSPAHLNSCHFLTCLHWLEQRRALAKAREWLWHDRVLWVPDGEVGLVLRAVKGGLKVIGIDHGQRRIQGMQTVGEGTRFELMNRVISAVARGPDCRGDLRSHLSADPGVLWHSPKVQMIRDLRKHPRLLRFALNTHDPAPASAPPEGTDLRKRK